jgi:hypothetical protein
MEKKFLMMNETKPKLSLAFGEREIPLFIKDPCLVVLHKTNQGLTPEE